MGPERRALAREEQEAGPPGRALLHLKDGPATDARAPHEPLRQASSTCRSVVGSGSPGWLIAEIERRETDMLETARAFASTAEARPAPPNTFDYADIVTEGFRTIRAGERV